MCPLPVASLGGTKGDPRVSKLGLLGTWHSGHESQHPTLLTQASRRGARGQEPQLSSWPHPAALHPPSQWEGDCMSPCMSLKLRSALRGSPCLCICLSCSCPSPLCCRLYRAPGGLGPAAPQGNKGATHLGACLWPKGHHPLVLQPPLPPQPLGNSGGILQFLTLAGEAHARSVFPGRCGPSATCSLQTYSSIFRRCGKSCATCRTASRKPSRTWRASARS